MNDFQCGAHAGKTEPPAGFACTHCRAIWRPPTAATVMSAVRAGDFPQFPAATATNRNRDVRGVCAIFASRRLAREAVISSQAMLQQQGAR